ncbi:IQ calmodulin-binding motif [Musa troglodytarum]|uniref:IQ calmodulin-binding motif n=1 Tax=Musa troglodytarum TaxID=320322 RepID=A0A9E7L1K0_9LILI|nr:IQ calmodulin-binding motif [Musa troglodytarum]
MYQYHTPEAIVATTTIPSTKGGLNTGDTLLEGGRGAVEEGGRGGSCGFNKDSIRPPPPTLPFVQEQAPDSRCFAAARQVMALDSGKLLSFLYSQFADKSHLTKGGSRPGGGESKNMEGKRKWTSALKKALIPSCCRDYGKSKRSSRAATEVGRSTISEATAATKIQAAFRGFLARRAMGTLKRLIRLKNLIDGSAVGSQTANMVRRLQAMAVVQAQVRSRRMRMAEEHQALLRQLQLKQEREQQKAKIGEWNDSPRSKEQIEAKLLDRQEAASRRERALAYAFAHQGKSSSKSLTPMFIDLNNLQWGWSLSERLTAAGPQEKHGHDAVKPKRIPSAAQRPSQAPVTPRSNPASKASVNPSKSKPSPRNESPATPRSKLASVASKKTPVSPGTGAWSADDGSSIRRRHRVTRSSVSDDSSSLSSALSVASYTPSTASTKARSRFHSPQSDVAEGSRKGSVGLGKKRLPSPAAQKKNGSSHAKRTK